MSGKSSGLFLLCWLAAAWLPAADWREALALAEMQALAQAEDWCRLDTGYYVALEDLDDIGVDGYQPEYNFIDDGGGAWPVDPDAARFTEARIELAEAFRPWGGPYLTFQSGNTDEADAFGYDRGTPLDPWGRPYYLYSPAGLLLPEAGSESPEAWGDRFDRYAIVSRGPDGAHDGEDDLFYLFGDAPTGTVLTGLSPLRAEAGDRLTLRGYGLDAAGYALFVSGLSVESSVSSRTATRLDCIVEASWPSGVQYLYLERSDGRQTRRQAVFLQDPRSRACGWWFYR